ncbi:type II toxin-antitoxin system death-on-curing family toxin [Helicobacter bizzozeronii]|uniref:type II toxin-antitoxin system death-on-curing family toxin n=1 Tax=Helicobacter bizzozeronii TaxID=56877 RepID=UPI000CEE07E4|nr:type II toxin-antitoxin system death-on-curing family toxin [Helicobacter bizzozeronii]
MVYISLDEAINIHDEIVGLTGGLAGINPVSVGYLESALEHIKNDDYYPTFESKVAHIFFACVKFHPFPDGNKRTALYLCIHFFFINGYVLPSEMEEKLEDIVVGVAEDKIPKEQLEVIFKDLVQQKHQNNTPAHIYKR